MIGKLLFVEKRVLLSLNRLLIVHYNVNRVSIPTLGTPLEDSADLGGLLPVGKVASVNKLTFLGLKLDTINL